MDGAKGHWDYQRIIVSTRSNVAGLTAIKWKPLPTRCPDSSIATTRNSLNLADWATRNDEELLPNTQPSAVCGGSADTASSAMYCKIWLAHRSNRKVDTASRNVLCAKPGVNAVLLEEQAHAKRVRTGAP